MTTLFKLPQQGVYDTA